MYLFSCLLLVPVDDLASFPVEDDDFRADDPKIGTHGQQLHPGSAMALVIALGFVILPGLARILGVVTIAAVAMVPVALVLMVAIATVAVSLIGLVATAVAATVLVFLAAIAVL